MAEKRDYYEVLGVGKTSTADEIKKAYRKLAREHHPDMAKAEEKESAEKKFKEINEAYQVISDDSKRKMYDQYGHAATSGAGFNNGGGQGFGGNASQWGPFSYSYTSGSPFGGEQGGVDPFEVFEDFFGFRGFGGQRAPRKGKNLSYEMVIEFKDAVHGVEKDVTIESGAVKIKIPQGARDGTELRFTGKGMPGPSGVPAGDLFITIRVVSPKEFTISGDSIILTKEIDFVMATLGGTLDIAVVDPLVATGLGIAKLNIPAGTQPGTRFLVRGKGMPKLQAKGQGDVLVQITVEIPKKISKKQKELLEAYKNS